MTANNKDGAIVTVTEEEREFEFLRNIAKFANITHELLFKLKKGVLPWKLILQQLQNLNEGKAHEMRIAFGKLSCWGNSAGLEKFDDFLPWQFGTSDFIKPGTMDSDENIMRLHGLETGEKLDAVTLAPYVMDGLEARMLKEAQDQGLATCDTIGLGHLYRFLERQIVHSGSNLLNREIEGNLFYIADCNEDLWRMKVELVSGRWFYELKRVEEGSRFDVTGAFIWLSARTR